MVKITKVNLENVINLLPSNNVTAEIKILEVSKKLTEKIMCHSVAFLGGIGLWLPPFDFAFY